jgi:hypothetical protein
MSESVTNHHLLQKGHTWVSNTVRHASIINCHWRSHALMQESFLTLVLRHFLQQGAQMQSIWRHICGMVWHVHSTLLPRGMLLELRFQLFKTISPIVLGYSGWNWVQFIIYWCCRHWLFITPWWVESWIWGTWCHETRQGKLQYTNMPKCHFLHLHNWIWDRTLTPTLTSWRLSTILLQPFMISWIFLLFKYISNFWYTSYFHFNSCLQKLKTGRSLTCSPSGQTHKYLLCHSSASLDTSFFDTLWFSQMTSSTWVMVSTWQPTRTLSFSRASSPHYLCLMCLHNFCNATQLMELYLLSRFLDCKITIQYNIRWRTCHTAFC